MAKKKNKEKLKFKETRNAFQLLVKENITMTDAQEIAQNLNGFFEKLKFFKTKMKGQ